MKEIGRYIVPSNKIINNNHGQHYRILQGKQKWIANQAALQIEGYEGICGFKVPSVEEIHSFTENGESFTLIFEIWKCQQTFDLPNYNATFKYMIDMLTTSGYFKDDSWKYSYPVMVNGGDYSVWEERAIRFENDGLPDNLRKDWWLENGLDPKKDTLIRIIVAPSRNIKDLMMTGIS